MKKIELEIKIDELEAALQVLSEVITDLESVVAKKHARIVELISENDRLTLKYKPYEPPKVKKVKKVKSEPRWFGSLSFDYWPARDWFRLSFKKYKPGKYAQITVGPIRWDWAAN